MKCVKIAEIDIQGCQSRMATDGDTVTEYAELIEGGTKLPPVDLYYDGSTYWCADGIHRILAAQRLKHEDIEATIHKGTKADALWHAAGANKTHGLHRSNEDKKRAVELALSLQPNMSVALIAEHVGVHPNTVTKYRKESGVTNCETSKRIGKDGKEYPVKPTAAKSAPKVSESEPEPEEPADDGDAIKAAQKPFNSILSQLDQAGTAMEKLAETPDGGYLKACLTSATGALSRSRSFVNGSRPVGICVKCDGAGCRHCCTTGWANTAQKRSKQ